MKNFKFLSGYSILNGVVNSNFHSTISVSNTNNTNNEFCFQNTISLTINNTVQRITAQTIGNDLVSVQPLATPTGVIFFMNHKYNKLTFKFFRG